MRGAKWMREASYLTEDDRKAILAEVERCRSYCRLMQSGYDAAMPHVKSWYDPKLVGIRPASYTGDPSPIAAITYGPGGADIWGFAYRQDPVPHSGVSHYFTDDQAETS